MQWAKKPSHTTIPLTEHAVFPRYRWHTGHDPNAIKISTIWKKPLNPFFLSTIRCNERKNLLTLLSLYRGLHAVCSPRYRWHTRHDPPVPGYAGRSDRQLSADGGQRGVTWPIPGRQQHSHLPHRHRTNPTQPQMAVHKCQLIFKRNMLYFNSFFFYSLFKWNNLAIGTKLVNKIAIFMCFSSIWMFAD